MPSAPSAPPEGPGEEEVRSGVSGSTAGSMDAPAPSVDEEWDGDEDDEDDEDNDEDDDDVRPRRAPWHFKVLLVGTVIYLGWRAYQGIEWLIHHVH